MDNVSIKELNQLLMFSGMLSSVHIQNLKSFPFIYFNEVKEARLEHDIATNKVGQSNVTYDLTLNKEANGLIDKRYKALELAVHQLLWKEVKVKLLINGEEYHE